jgi:hypothetical protein
VHRHSRRRHGVFAECDAGADQQRTRAVSHHLADRADAANRFDNELRWPPDGEQQPGVSTLNAGDGSVTSNMAVVPNHGDGMIDAYAHGTTQLILDISGYFAP